MDRNFGLDRNRASHFKKMEDFGEARFILSPKLTMSHLVCESETMPGYFFVFTRQSGPHLLTDGTEAVYFECVGCRRLKGKLRGRVTVNNGRVKTDPDLNHNGSCRPLTRQQVESMQTVRQLTIEGEVESANPRKSYKKGVEEYRQRMGDPFALPPQAQAAGMDPTSPKIPTASQILEALDRQLGAVSGTNVKPQRARVRSAHKKRPIFRQDGSMVSDPNLSMEQDNSAPDTDMDVLAAERYRPSMHDHQDAAVLVNNAKDQQQFWSVAATTTVQTSPASVLSSLGVSSLGSLAPPPPHHQPMVFSQPAVLPTPTVSAIQLELRQIMQAANRTRVNEDFAKAILVKIREVKVLYQAADQISRAVEEFDKSQDPVGYMEQHHHHQNSTPPPKKVPRISKPRKSADPNAKRGRDQHQPLQQNSIHNSSQQIVQQQQHQQQQSRGPAPPPSIQQHLEQQLRSVTTHRRQDEEVEEEEDDQQQDQPDQRTIEAHRAVHNIQTYEMTYEHEEEYADEEDEDAEVAAAGEERQQLQQLPNQQSSATSSSR